MCRTLRITAVLGLVAIVAGALTGPAQQVCESRTARWPVLFASILPRRNNLCRCQFARRSRLGQRASGHGCQHAGDPHRLAPHQDTDMAAGAVFSLTSQARYGAQRS